MAKHKTFGVCGPLVLSLTLLTTFVAAATIELPIDKNHSTIGFSVPIMGLSQVRGKFTEFTVAIEFDEADVTRSSVSAVIKSASVDTGIDDRDKHLRSADFFDAEKYPEITFRSTRIERRGDAYVAHGTFSMRGVTKQIALPFRVTGRSVSDNQKEPGKELLVMGFAADTTINRQNYGINWKHSSVPAFVADEIEIEIHLLTRAAVVAPR